MPRKYNRWPIRPGIVQTAFILPVILLLTVATGLPVQAATDNYPASVHALVAAAKTKVRIIDLAAFKAALANRSGMLLIDVREPGEFFDDGHIAGAINIPRGQIELNIWPFVGFPEKTNLRKKIVLYCGTSTRSILAAKSLKDLGFTDVTAVDMKMADWIKAGLPLEN